MDQPRRGHAHRFGGSRRAAMTRPLKRAVAIPDRTAERISRYSLSPRGVGIRAPNPLPASNSARPCYPSSSAAGWPVNQAAQSAIRVVPGADHRSLSNAVEIQTETKTDCWHLVGAARGISDSEGANQPRVWEGTGYEQKTDHLDRALARLLASFGLDRDGAGRRDQRRRPSAATPATTVTLPKVLQDAGLTDVTSDQMRRGGTRIQGTLPDGQKIGAMLAQDGTSAQHPHAGRFDPLPPGAGRSAGAAGGARQRGFTQVGKPGRRLHRWRGVMVAGKDAQGPRCLRGLRAGRHA